MKKTKRAISFLLCLIMLFGTFAVGTGGFAELLNSISIKASAASATPSISADYAYNRSGSECVLTYYYSWNAYSGASYYIFYNGYKNGTINYKQKVTKTSLTSTNGNSAVSSYDNGYVSQIWVVPYDSNGTALTSNITYCEPIGGVWAFKHGINYISTDLNNPFLTTDTQKCNAETTLTTNQPTRTGYTFKGWSESKNATTAEYQPGETYYVAHSNQYDIYLYAVWKANTYKVSFNANGGSCSTSSKTVTYDSTYGTLPTPTRTGYTFSGWYTSASGGTQITSSKKVTITSAQTLYAHWSANTYNITFNATNGGSCSTSSKTVTYDSTYGTLPISTKSGYTFTGWYSSLIGGTQITSSSTVTITSDETLYAHWSDSSKPTGFISSTNNLAASQTVTLSFSDNESIAGYYWGTSSTYSYNTYTSTTSLSITKTISSAGTYYLVVKDGAGNVSDSVSITFHLTTLNANNGSVTPAAILTQNGCSFALPTAERDGYTFLGWATSSTATSAQYQPGASFNLNDNMILYAVWEKTAYTAKFIVDGQIVSSMTCYYGDTINKPADPSKSGYTFTGWAPEVPATMPEQNLTFYAQWEQLNIYNLGEETYNFHNYGDSDSPGGHCFGMAVTSSGYYLGTLDKSTIGGNTGTPLYTFSDSPIVRRPICHYIQIQGSAADGAERRAMVAGGSIDLEGYMDIEYDWNSCVNYVKNHEHDNSGTLNVGMWFGEGGGHAVNFLYYKEVGGQQRIYVYDNNYPDTEMYYYMGNDGYVHEGPSSEIYSDYHIIGIDLMDVNIYFPLADRYEPYRYIFANKNEITVKGATVSYLKCDSELSDYVMYEIPEEAKSVTVTPLVDNADFSYLGNDYSFGSINEKTSGILTVPSKNATEGQKTNFEIKNAPVSPTASAKLNAKSSTTVDYRSKVNITATASGVPDGYFLAIYSGNNLLEKGTKDKVTYTPKDSNNKPVELKSDVTYTVKVIDGKNAVQKDSNGNDLTANVEIKVKQGFFDKLIAFFKGLFGLLPTVEIKP